MALIYTSMVQMISYFIGWYPPGTFWNASWLRQDAVILEKSTFLHLEGEQSYVWFAIMGTLFRVEQIGKENNRDIFLTSKDFAFV